MTGPHLVATVTVILSFLAGIAFGALLCFRHRRTGMLGLAATCAGMAVIVVVTETAGGSTIGQALKMAAVFAFFPPIFGAVLACVIIVIARLLWRITRRTVKAIWTFSGNVLTDVRRIAKRPSDQERGPRRLSKASLLRAIAKSPEAQEKLDDMALVFGHVVFTYSRALSMLG
jgi:hypothetical protein